jgi:thiamine-phosphate pyrophosphorylase
VRIQLPPVYPITDTALSGLSIPEQVRQMTAGGATLIQLREKKASSRDFYKAASHAIEFARTNDARIIINDRVDIAMLLDADGVHLGQEDLSPVHARRLLGEKAIIGYSTHNLSQAAEAVKLPIDYLAFGPVFPTSTKENPDPVVGLELLAEVKGIAADLPLIAIGGIDETNIASVWTAGADSAAMIGNIVAGPNGITANMRSLLSITDRGRFVRGFNL